MRILLIGNYPPDRQQSMLRFASLMERELTTRGHQVTLLQPQPILTSRINSGGMAKWLGYIDKFVLFPSTLKKAKRGFDVVHICDHSNSMYARYLTGTPNLATCHDVLAIKSALGEVPENPVSSTGRRLQAMILAGLKRAQYIVCDSAISRTDMLRVTGRRTETSDVVYLSLNYPYAPMPRAEALARLDALGYDARMPFFLHVGAGVWYKNRLGVLQIFKLLRDSAAPEARLLFIGDPPDAEMQNFMFAHKIEAQVASLSGLSNADLEAVYSLAEGLLFPSVQEGFGWPVLEAQSCGCPVFASGRAPMTELGGDAAVYFDPTDIPGAAKIIAQALERRAAICEDGLVNVKRFSVQNMIDGYVSAYEKVAGHQEDLH